MAGLNQVLGELSEGMRIVKLNGAGAIQLRLAIDRSEKFAEIEGASLGPLRDALSQLFA